MSNKSSPKMSKAEVLKALNTKGTRVFARLRFGMKALAMVEQQKSTLLPVIKDLADDALIGAKQSKTGHLYIHGVNLEEAIALGEVEKIDAKVAAEAQPQEQA